jgi:hypothetical protein
MRCVRDLGSTARLKPYPDTSPSPYRLASAFGRGGAHRTGWWHGAKSLRLLVRPFMAKLPHAKCGLLPSIGTSRIRKAVQNGFDGPRNAAESRLGGVFSKMSQFYNEPTENRRKRLNGRTKLVDTYPGHLTRPSFQMTLHSSDGAVGVAC